VVGGQPALDLLGEDRQVRRRTLGALGVLLALGPLGALSGCQLGGSAEDSGADKSSSSTPTAPASSPATRAPRPTPSTCYRLTFDAAIAPTTDTPKVSCKHGYTARTFYVGVIDAVVRGHLLAVDSHWVRDQIATECPRRLAKYLDGSREELRLTMLRTVWFSPTIAESDEGQDWFRCDVIALAGNQRLSTLHGSVKSALSGDGDKYAMCGTDDPSSKDFERVICSRHHSWRAIATIDSSAAKYPGSSKLRSKGKAECEGPARSVADDPLNVTWSYEPPTKDQWRAGQHYGICWVPA